MSRPLEPLVLSETERAELSALAARRKTAQALAMRARIVLLAGDGTANKEIAAKLDIDPATVGKWRRRFLADRQEGLRDEPRSGAPRKVDDARIEAVIVRTLEGLPDGATHWSSRGMAKASGLSTSTVQRIWRAFGLQPHRAEARGVPRPGPAGAALPGRGARQTAVKVRSTRRPRAPAGSLGGVGDGV